MGRPPTPLELKELRGNTHHGSKSEEKEIVEYVPAQIELVKPPGLKKHGSEEWDKIWVAGKAWLNPSADYPWVEQICRSYDEIDQYRRKIKKTGLIVEGYNGQQTANPLIREVRAAEATVRKCLSMIGFSPTDRARLGLMAIKQESGLAALQASTDDHRDNAANADEGEVFWEAEVISDTDSPDA